MTKQELFNILTKSQVSFNFQPISIWGSEYLSVNDVTYRLSDHDKPNYHIWNGVDCKSWEDVYNHAIERGIDLSDKTEMENEFKEKLRSEIEVTENGTATHSYFGMYTDVDSLLNSAWNQIVRENFIES